MSPTLLRSLVLALVAGAAVADLPRSVKRCMDKECGTGSFDCGSNCLGLTRTQMEEDNDCRSDCLGDTDSLDSMESCLDGCNSILQQYLDYPIEEVMAYMVNTGEDSLDSDLDDILESITSSTISSTTSSKAVPTETHDDDDKDEADDTNGGSTGCSVTGTSKKKGGNSVGCSDTDENDGDEKNILTGGDDNGVASTVPVLSISLGVVLSALAYQL
ncbi:hypothetical protein IWQ61_008920 [Dispira simplex]|nr:hypothetical protein IWQ61_008920 [Dispira simplex]